VPDYKTARIHFGRSGRLGRVDARKGILSGVETNDEMATGMKKDGIETMPALPK